MFVPVTVYYRGDDTKYITNGDCDSIPFVWFGDTVYFKRDDTYYFPNQDHPQGQTTHGCDTTMTVFVSNMQYTPRPEIESDDTDIEVTWLTNQYILIPLNLTFLQTIAFILIIAALVQMVEIILKKISPSLYTALGVFLPLITTNCAVLGVSLTVVTKEFNYGGVAHMLSLGESIIYAVGIALGFAMALIIFAGIREHIDLMVLIISL